MYDQVFDDQDGFGLKPWGDYATAAGVPNLATFFAIEQSARRSTSRNQRPSAPPPKAWQTIT